MYLRTHVHIFQNILGCDCVLAVINFCACKTVHLVCMYSVFVNSTLIITVKRWFSDFETNLFS